MINPLYKQMVVNTTNQHLMPKTADRKLTLNDLQMLSNQAPSMPEHVGSAVNFLLTTFEQISVLGDQDATSISDQDIQAFAQKGINLSVDA